MAGALDTDSSRPILKSQEFSTRSSKRFSSYSKSPSVAATDMSYGSVSTADTRVIEIKNYTTTLHRLDSKPLQAQRYDMSVEKEIYLSKLALGAKVQRALDRRFTSQDAEFRPKRDSEKPDKPSS